MAPGKPVGLTEAIITSSGALSPPQINVNDKFETLLAGGVVQEPIREDLTYDIAHSTEDNLWSIQYLTGYMTQVPPEKLPAGIQPEDGKAALRIPNEEVKSVFSSTVKKWFEEKITAQACACDRGKMVRKENGGRLEKECTDALQQIEKEQYRKTLEHEGYKTVLCYGGAFRGKICLIKLAG